MYNHVPKVSVLMNCFNGERYIGKAIESILNQSWDDLELVIWDNQSTDGSANIISGFSDSRIRVISAPEHTTLALARMHAFGYLRGSWVGILDVDDLWRPEKLARQMAVAEKNPGIGFVYCRTNVISNHQSYGYRFDSTETSLPQGNIYRRLLRGNFISVASLLINRSRLESIGGFSGKYPIMEDYYVTLNLARQFPVAAVNQVLCDYRLHGENASSMEAVDHFEDLQIVRQLFPEPGACAAAARIVLRHFKKCMRQHRKPQFAELTRALC